MGEGGGTRDLCCVPTAPLHSRAAEAEMQRGAGRMRGSDKRRSGEGVGQEEEWPGKRGGGGGGGQGDLCFSPWPARETAALASSSASLATLIDFSLSEA